jgi:hypothetical protein
VTSVAVIVGIFFIVGITVGIIVVAAMSVLRRDERHGSDDGPGHRPDGLDEQPPDLDWGRTATDDRPWWKSRDGG